MQMSEIPSRVQAIDSKRIKLILKFLERVHQNSHQIDEVEVVSKSALKVTWSQDNQRDNVNSTFSNFYLFDSDKNEIGSKINNFPIQIKDTIQANSPSNTYKVVIQQVEEKSKNKSFQVLEIYKNEDVVAQLNLSNYHEQIFNDNSVSSTISWNRLETKFLYTAQVKQKPTKTFFEVEEDKDLEQAQRNYQYNQNFGEGMTEVTEIHLFEYNLENNSLNEIQIPENTFPCYPQYLDGQGDQITFCGYQVHPEYKYCIQVLNRYADIYYLNNLQRRLLFPKASKDEEEDIRDKKKIDFKIISQDETSIKPNVSYDGKKIAYFGAPLSPPHLNYLSLKIINISDWSIEEILPIKYDNLADKDEFMGVCNYTKDLKNSFWLNDNIHYTFSSLIGPTISSYIVNTQTKQISKFNPHKILSDEFQVVHYNPLYNTLFASHVNFIEPKSIALLKNLDLSLEPDQITRNAQWQYISLTQESSSIFPSLRKCALDFLEEQLIKTSDSTGCLLRIKNFNREAIPSELLQLFDNNDSLNPLNYKEDSERPLIVDVHGGPHATYGGEFTITNLYSLLQGYTILLPNFSGSGGYGQSYINKLLSKIGDVDEKDIINMIDQVIDKKLCNPNKIIIIGGSYGGYLASMITSKHPNRFICQVISNAVLNIPFTFNISDIPDWCMAESLGRKMNWNLTGEDYKKMFEQSPMNLINKVPTLNLVGGKDKRVPPQQSIAYHAQNIFNGNEIETLIFPELGHSLVDYVHPHFDAILKQITFIEKHLLQNSTVKI